MYLNCSWAIGMSAVSATIAIIIADILSGTSKILISPALPLAYPERSATAADPEDSSVAWNSAVLASLFFDDLKIPILDISLLHNLYGVFNLILLFGPAFFEEFFSNLRERDVGKDILVA